MTITSTPTRARPAKRLAGTILVWLLVLPGIAWAVVRLGGWETGPLVLVFAFTPYAAAGALLPLLVAVLARRWLASAVALVAVAFLAVAVVPRAIPDHGTGPAGGVPLRVLTANLLFGRADPAAVVGLVRDRDVAILAVQEFTPQAQQALSAAGLEKLLPYSSLAPEVGTTGSGLYSRYPLTAPGSHRNPGGFLQATGTVQPPGAAPLLVESAHPSAPYAVAALNGWRTDLANQPRADAGAAPRILLGDFNATLDHHLLRRLIATGYRDAADAAGTGLVGTWGPYDGDVLPPVTIDHVLVDRRIGVRDAEVYAIPRSDHRAVFASLAVPAA